MKLRIFELYYDVTEQSSLDFFFSAGFYELKQFLTMTFHFSDILEEKKELLDIIDKNQLGFLFSKYVICNEIFIKLSEDQILLYTYTSISGLIF